MPHDRYQLYNDMFNVWCRINYHKPVCKQDVLNQCSWYHTDIKVENKILTASKDVMNTLKTIKAFYVENENRFCTFVEIRSKYPELKINFLEYYTLTASIPKEWYRIMNLKNLPQKTLTEKIQQNTSIKPAKFAYVHFINEIPRKDDKYRQKWANILDRDISDYEWENMAKETERITSSTQLRAFQYQIINFALVMNIQMYKWGKNK